MEDVFRLRVIRGPWKDNEFDACKREGITYINNGTTRLADNMYEIIKEESMKPVKTLPLLSNDIFTSDNSGQLILWEEALDIEGDVEVNEKGGRQTFLRVAMDQIPPLAMLAVGKILKIGLKYGRYNWLKIGTYEQLNHATTHIEKTKIYARELAVKELSDADRDILHDRVIQEASQATTRMLFFLDRLIEETAELRKQSPENVIG